MNSHTDSSAQHEGIEEAELAEESTLAGTPEVDSDREEDYEPGIPRPDLSGEAEEADVAEQAQELPADEIEYER